MTPLLVAGCLAGCLLALVLFVVIWWRSQPWFQATRMPPASVNPPTVVHVSAYPICPIGYVRFPGFFKTASGELEDAWILPGATVCVDFLRPGEACQVGVLFCLVPMVEAKRPDTPGGK